MQVAGANEDILSGGSEAKVGKLAPPPRGTCAAGVAYPTNLAASRSYAGTDCSTLGSAPAPMAAVTAAPPKPVAGKARCRAGEASDNGAGWRAARTVQLAAVHSEDAARSEWDRLSKRVPDLLGPHSPFSKIDHDGHALWRVRTGGFSDTAQATSSANGCAPRGELLGGRLLKAAIVGIGGLTLTADEAAVFRANPPCGVILFARNIQAPPQLAALIAHLRRVLPAGALLMVDQEGGRVARLRPPHWRAHPPAAQAGRGFARHG